ncbi:MAG: transcription termination/antitermination protein NusG [Candidatus Kapabacteria bacterium]|nr:transcription termination/antitermination protein NusG [Candidatus Kapabacteria bacterium]MCS7170228.1 transcription termination/antitermination protein NusG [Candidatus Kapabacteria bacterium]MDW8225189.1 transcription termination/antitermination protein NusG [Bacteroidota bacterium]
MPSVVPQAPESTGKTFRWYALYTASGQENRVRQRLERELELHGLRDRVRTILIPEETVFEIRSGKRKTRKRSFLPGYILIEVALDRKLRQLIEGVAGVVGFAGTRTQPVPLRPEEVERILARLEERKHTATIETQFSVGDPVRIIDGPFANFVGVVKEVNLERQKLKVEVGILGRKTPVELDIGQVELAVQTSGA